MNATEINPNNVASTPLTFEEDLPRIEANLEKSAERAKTLAEPLEAIADSHKKLALAFKALTAIVYTPGDLHLSLLQGRIITDLTALEARLSFHKTMAEDLQATVLRFKEGISKYKTSSLSDAEKKAGLEKHFLGPFVFLAEDDTRNVADSDYDSDTDPDCMGNVGTEKKTD